MRRPVINVEAIKTLVQILITWLVVMGFWELTEIQQATTLALAIAVLNVVGGYFESIHTTPLVEPKAKDGEPLVRSSAANRTRSAAVDLRKTSPRKVA